MSHSATRLCLSFHMVYARLRLQLDDELGTYHGIDLEDFALLHTLAGAGDDPACLEHIASVLGSTRSDLLRRLRPLEKIGLLAFHGGIRERRIALREPGRSLVESAGATIERVCAGPSLIGHLEQLKETLSGFAAR